MQPAELRQPVVVVDDHPRAREMLGELVAATTGLCLVASLSSGEAAVSYAATAATPLLVVMDVRMPGIGGVEAATRITGGSARHVVVLVSSDGEAHKFVPAQDRITFIDKSRLTGRLLLDARRNTQSNGL